MVLRGRKTSQLLRAQQENPALGREIEGSKVGSEQSHSSTVPGDPGGNWARSYGTVTLGAPVTGGANNVPLRVQQGPRKPSWKRDP